MADPSSLPAQLGLSAAKLAPAAAVTVYGVLAKGLPLIVAFATLIYVSVQIAHLVWTWRGQIRHERQRGDDA